MPEERLFRAFSDVRGVLFHKLLVLLDNYEDAQDTLQVAFLHCWQARAQLSTIRNVHSWVLRVGINAGKDLLRNGWHRRAKPIAAVPHPPSPAPPPEEILLRRERTEELSAAILALPFREREVFLLRQHTGLPYEEIARLVHSPVGTVKTRMRSAIARLRLALRYE